ncbi:Uncharacterised protein [Streptococcus pneumoniae]|nr:Uncharacterised protein [Streptococcus pneumoniae]
MPFFANDAGTIFFANFVNNGPAMSTVGTATIKPYSSTSPMFAPYSPAIAVGPGCGGRKPCVTDSAATIGIPRNKIEIFNSLEIAKTIGINRTSPTSKNNAIPIMNEAMTTAH